MLLSVCIQYVIWASIASLFVSLGFLSSESWAFHASPGATTSTTINSVVGRFDTITSLTELSMAANDDKSKRNLEDSLAIPFRSIARWLGNKKKQRRQRINYEMEQGRCQRTSVPHVGSHFSRYRRKRFMEGWYYRLTLKDYRLTKDGSNNIINGPKPVSFAFIISIEDPGIKSSELRLACLQAIGPNNQYLVQATKDDTKFWAARQNQSLGCTFQVYDCDRNNKILDKKNDNYEARQESSLSTTINLADNHTIFGNTPVSNGAEMGLDPKMRYGFQILDDSDSDISSRPRWMGRINGHDGSKGGVLDGQGVQGNLEFDFSVDPTSVCGYGGYTSTTNNDDKANSSYATDTTQKRRGNQYAQRQRSTGGWLSSFPIFEPHWQITMADSLATGSVTWNGTKYTFENQPFYAEKNWGKALPSKWYWTQCNSFDNNEGELSVTGGGGIRKLPFGREEELGMIAVHHNGRFYEAVPWKGNVEWNVSTWGDWSLYGDRLEETITYNSIRNESVTTPPFAVEVRYRCDNPGLVFRAPTPKHGMVPFCRDTFEADCEMTLWELKKNEITKVYEKVEPPIINRAKSKEGGAEIGGGPWWSDWHGKSKLKPVIKKLLNFPSKFI